MKDTLLLSRSKKIHSILGPILETKSYYIIRDGIVILTDSKRELMYSRSEMEVVPAYTSEDLKSLFGSSLKVGVAYRAVYPSSLKASKTYSVRLDGIHGVYYSDRLVDAIASLIESLSISLDLNVEKRRSLVEESLSSSCYYSGK